VKKRPRPNKGLQSHNNKATAATSSKLLSRHVRGRTEESYAFSSDRTPAVLTENQIGDPTSISVNNNNNNLILYYLCAKSKATRSITTKTTTIIIIIIIICKLFTIENNRSF
jgi:hypothetical protein